jgi:hypothetical protein
MGIIERGAMKSCLTAEILAISTGFVYGFIPNRSENMLDEPQSMLIVNPLAILKPVTRSIGTLFTLSFGFIARRVSIMVKLCERHFGLLLT